jgi:hypothetical protein
VLICAQERLSCYKVHCIQLYYCLPLIHHCLGLAYLEQGFSLCVHVVHKSMCVAVDRLFVSVGVGRLWEDDVALGGVSARASTVVAERYGRRWWYRVLTLSLNPAERVSLHERLGAMLSRVHHDLACARTGFIRCLLRRTEQGRDGKR